LGSTLSVRALGRQVKAIRGAGGKQGDLRFAHSLSGTPAGGSMSVIGMLRQQRSLHAPVVLNYCRHMRIGLHFILAVGLLMSLSLFAQAPSESEFLLRMKHLKSDFSLRTSTTCIAVFPDGRFHLEQRGDWPESKSEVYEGSLPESELQSLRTIIDDPELEDLKGIESGKYVLRQGEQGEFVWVLISRGETTQRLLFNSQTGTAERSSKALPKPMRKLVGWNDGMVKTLNSRKMHPLKNVKPVMCWLSN